MQASSPESKPSFFNNGSRDVFLNVLSHELRTPLTPVLAAAELLASPFKLSDAEVKKQAELILRNVMREVRLFDELLDMARVVRGGMRLARRDVDMHRVILEAVEQCGDNASRRDVKFDVELLATTHAVRGDATRLRQLVVSLLANASKFSYLGGRVLVRSFSATPDTINVMISDQGLGIGQERLETIFEPFRPRERGLTSPTEGLGFSLAIARGLAEAHDGTLTAQSEGVGKGASFVLQLPTLSGAAQARSAEPPGGGASRSSTRASTILLVDDHDDTRRALRALLERRGYEVMTAASMREAKEIAATEKFDIMVSDISMPDGSGLELMESLKPKGVRAVAISGYGTDEDVERSRAAGFAEHLTKPISFEALEAALERLRAGG